MTKKPNDVCDWTRGRLPLLASPRTRGELSDPARDRADRHLAGCPQCRDRLRRLGDAMQALNIAAETPDPDADPQGDAEAHSLWPHLRQRIRESQSLPVVSTFPVFEIRLAETTGTAASSTAREVGFASFRRWSIAAGLLVTAAVGAFALSRTPAANPGSASRASKPAAVAESSPRPMSTADRPATPIAADPTPSTIAAEASQPPSNSESRVVRRDLQTAPETELEAPTAPSVEPIRPADVGVGLSR